jgi:hypothetical protein
MQVSSNALNPINALKRIFLDSQNPRDLVQSLKRRGLTETISSWIKPSSQQIRQVKMQEWQRAIASAQDPDNPSRLPLLRLYDRAMYDDTVTATTEMRILRLQQSTFAWVNQNGEVNEELTASFKKEWFENYMRWMLERKFYGFSLVEISEVDPSSGISALSLINRKHVLQYKKMVLRRESDSAGQNYLDQGMENWIIEVGEERELGILSKVIPLIILKSIAQGGWGRYTEVFGIPLRWIKTESKDKKRLDDLAEMLQNMAIDPWVVLQGDEEFQVADNKLGSEGFKNFDMFWQRIDSAIARTLLGNDGTISNKDSHGTYGSIKSMAELQEYIHHSDKTYIANLVNLHSQKWAMHGYKTQGFTFKWDELEELDQKDLVDAVSKLAPNFELDLDYLKKRGLPIIGNKNKEQSDPLGK